MKPQKPTVWSLICIHYFIYHVQIIFFISLVCIERFQVQGNPYSVSNFSLNCLLVVLFDFSFRFCITRSHSGHIQTVLIFKTIVKTALAFLLKERPHALLTKAEGIPGYYLGCLLIQSSCYMTLLLTQTIIFYLYNFYGIMRTTSKGLYMPQS